MSDKSLVLDYYKSLKFDNTEMDTALAEDYLKKHNKKFTPITEKTDNCLQSTTVDNNTVVCLKREFLSMNTFEMFDKNILWNVAALIRRNAELFAQLEFMIRGIPQKDVKKYDVKVLADQFEYASKSSNYDGKFAYINEVLQLHQIYLKANLPLCTLAQAAMYWAKGYTVYIIPSENTTAVCILFAELCFEAGIPNNKLYVEPRSDVDFTIKSLSIENSSNIAVFTEHADMESGVDIVFDITTERVYPWSLRRIIVQENSCVRFKQTIQNKVGSLNLRKLPIEDIDNIPELVDFSTYIPDLLEKCKDVLYHKNKLLAFDYAGYLEGDAAKTRIVQVDTYRTTKELFSLMRRYQPKYLSLWCEQISTANEIVFGLDVPNICLNDFGLFAGPGGVAETFFKHSHYSRDEILEVPEKVLKSLMKWNKTCIDDRKSALENALNKIYDKENNSLTFDKDFIINYVRTWNDTSSLNIRDGVLCQQIKLPVGVIQIVTLNNNFLDVIRTLLIGNILYCVNTGAFNKDDFEIFSSYDVPIIQTNKHIQSKFPGYITCIGNNKFITHPEPNVLYLFLTKTIWSSFGETFAN